MSEIGIRWKGATLDPSGYGSANRDYIFALHGVGADITIEPWNFEARSAEFYGEKGVLIEKLKDRDIDYQFVVHHYVPNKIKMGEGDENKIHVGLSTWEADKIPEHWISNINDNFDLQFVPSQYNKKAYINSGIKIPVEVIPHCVDVAPFDNTEPTQFPKYEKSFKFLSVFQWIERKNPLGLIKAYSVAFYDVKDVVLLLKTYGLNHTEQEKERIRNSIKLIKRDTQLDPSKMPAIYLIPDLISRNEMLSLYKASDCFVLPSRSEGFGIPYAEACAGENAVIATDHGGQIDFLSDTYTQFISSQLTPVAHMPFPYYNSLMKWAEPNLIDLMNAMWNCYAFAKKDNTLFSSVKKAARKDIKKKLGYDIVGNEFKTKLLQFQQERKDR